MKLDKLEEIAPGSRLAFLEAALIKCETQKSYLDRIPTAEYKKTLYNTTGEDSKELEELKTFNEFLRDDAVDEDGNKAGYIAQQIANEKKRLENEKKESSSDGIITKPTEMGDYTFNFDGVPFIIDYHEHTAKTILALPVNKNDEGKAQYILLQQVLKNATEYTIDVILPSDAEFQRDRISEIYGGYYDRIIGQPDYIDASFKDEHDVIHFDYNKPDFNDFMNLVATTDIYKYLQSENNNTSSTLLEVSEPTEEEIERAVEEAKAAEEEVKTAEIAVTNAQNEVEAATTATATAEAAVVTSQASTDEEAERIAKANAAAQEKKMAAAQEKAKDAQAKNAAAKEKYRGKQKNTDKLKKQKVLAAKLREQEAAANQGGQRKSGRATTPRDFDYGVTYKGKNKKGQMIS